MATSNLDRIANEEVNEIRAVHRAVQRAARFPGALEAMRRMVNSLATNGTNGNGSVPTPAPQRVAQRNGAVWPTGIKANIEKILPRLAGQEFTFKDVGRVLAETGHPISAKNHRSAVGQTLAKLVNARKVVLVRKGVGGAPSTYKIA